ncbi:MAG: PrsW family intramembrane metalloprotease [Halobacteriota archaeon]
MPFLSLELLLPVIIAPVVEELCKFAVVRLRVYNRAEFNEPVDGIVYAAAAALGFATVENIFFLGGTFFDVGVLVFIVTFVVRALISVPSHAIFSSTWGYALGLAKCTPKVQKGHIVVTGVLLAILLHGIFNFLALTGILFAFDMLIFVPLGWILVNSRIMRALSVPLELSTAPLADRQLRATPVFALIAVLSFIAAPCGERGADSK